MFGLLLMVVASSVSLSQTADPFIGTWKLNVEQSTFDPGPAPRDLTCTYEDRGDGVILFTANGTDAQGNRTFIQWAFKRDGKDYPSLMLGAKAPGSISVKRVDAYTDEHIGKTDGEISSTFHVTISEDGKTMTRTGKNTDAQGRQHNDIRIYERQ